MIYIVLFCNSVDVVKKVFSSKILAEEWIKKQAFTEELRPGEWYKFTFKGDPGGPKERFLIKNFKIDK